MGYLSDAQRMDVTEQGVTELVVRISEGTVTLNNRPRAGGARYDTVRARRTALELLPRPRSLFAAPPVMDVYTVVNYTVKCVYMPCVESAA